MKCRSDAIARAFQPLPSLRRQGRFVNNRLAPAEREDRLIFTRRNLIQAGAAAGLVAAAKPVFATVAPHSPKIDEQLKLRALLALHGKGSRVRYRDVIGIADFDKASRDPRFYLLDVASGIATEYHVTHGRGSDPAHSGWLQSFSNEIGSEATSRGAYVTGDVYYGKYGRSLRLTGLDRTNYNADTRAIVVHAADYAEPHMIEAYGKLGRSEGCFALSQLSLQYVLLKLGPGRLLYADKV